MKTGRDAAKAGCQPGDRVPPDGQEGRRAQRDQDQVACIRGDARQHADEDDEVGNQGTRGDLDQLADQGSHQPGDFSRARAHHGDERDGQRAEALEVRNKGS